MTTTSFAAVLAPIFVMSAAILPAAAQAEAPRNQTSVAYADLDLTSEAGQRSLDRRIERAARAVCGIGEVRTGTRVRSSDASACYRDAMRSSRARVAEALKAGQHGG